MAIQFNGICERKVLLAKMKMKCESICYDNLITDRRFRREDFNLLIAANYRDYIHRKNKRRICWRIEEEKDFLDEILLEECEKFKNPLKINCFDKNLKCFVKNEIFSLSFFYFFI